MCFILFPIIGRRLQWRARDGNGGGNGPAQIWGGGGTGQARGPESRVVSSRMGGSGRTVRLSPPRDTRPVQASIRDGGQSDGEVGC